MSRTIEIPPGLRDLHARWSALDMGSQNFAYATVEVPAGTTRAAFEEASKRAGGIDLHTATAEQAKRYYAAHDFRIWLGAFVRTQAHYVEIGLMPKLRDFYAAQDASDLRAAA